MIPTISIRRAMFTRRLIGPVSTLVVCILICYEGVVITKSYSNKIDHRRNQYESNLRRRKLQQLQVGSSNTNEYTYVDEYTQHNEYTYVDDNEEVNSNDEVDDPLLYEYDNCIVGSGLSGAIIAEQYATRYDQSSLIIEKRNHIGGNLYDYVDDSTGIRVNAYGSAHLLNTDNERVWEYVQQFATWIPYEHKILDLVNKKNVQVPLNVDTVSEMFDSKRLDTSTEESKSRISRLLFGSTDVSEPTQETNEQVKLTKEEGYIPQDGYTDLFNNMLDNDKITIVTNTNYFDVKDQLKCQRLYYAGPIDLYFEDFNWPKLEYKSVSFDRVYQEGSMEGKDQDVTVAVVNRDEELSTEDDFTRIVEYKDISDQEASDASVYFIELDTDEGEPYYPVQSVEKQQRNIELYNRYKEMAEKEDGVTFIGGLANYKYFSMDESE